MPKPKTKPKKPKQPKPLMTRLPKGSAPNRVLIQLTEEMGAATRTAAEREGITLSEWWRRAATTALAVRKKSR